MHKHRKSNSNFMSILRKGGVLALPPAVSIFRIGQRVYFHARADGVVISARPRRCTNGRLVSSRIKRGLRSLTLYGPRAIAKPKTFPQRGASSLARRSATSRFPTPRSSAMAGRNLARG